MKWLLRLYPRAWQRRYGEEFIDLVASQPMSVALFVDVIAAAIDAWISPQVSTATQAASAGKESGHMLANRLNLHCVGRAAELTRSERWRSVVVMLTSALVLTVVWIWIYWRTRGNPYVDSMAFLPLAWSAPYLYTLRYSHLKSRPPATQALFIGGVLALLAVLLLVFGVISARI